MSLTSLSKVAREEAQHPRGWGALDVGNFRLRDTGWAYWALGRKGAQGCKIHSFAVSADISCIYHLLRGTLIAVVHSMPARTQGCCRCGLEWAAAESPLAS